mmetsp:Transcript_20426/g.50115  ORF Transcript_20426/g.50115 Transcript_20426/m.50115 type:complete len:89 (-) Transcript_20426:1053-1319(-)
MWIVCLSLPRLDQTNGGEAERSSLPALPGQRLLLREKAGILLLVTQQSRVVLNIPVFFKNSINSCLHGVLGYKSKHLPSLFVRKRMVL